MRDRDPMIIWLPPTAADNAICERPLLKDLHKLKKRDDEVLIYKYMVNSQKKEKNL